MFGQCFFFYLRRIHWKYTINTLTYFVLIVTLLAVQNATDSIARACVKLVDIFEVLYQHIMITII